MDEFESRGGLCTGDGPCDTHPIGLGKNWVTKVGGLPEYIRAIAHALLLKGHGEQDAISLAVGTVKRWAAGGGNVTAKTRATAAAAVAEWEAKKAAARWSDEDELEFRQGGPTNAKQAQSQKGAKSSSSKAKNKGAKPVKGKGTGQGGKGGKGDHAAGHPFYGNQHTKADGNNSNGDEGNGKGSLLDQENAKDGGSNFDNGGMDSKPSSSSSSGGSSGSSGSSGSGSSGGGSGGGSSGSSGGGSGGGSSAPAAPKAPTAAQQQAKAVAAAKKAAAAALASNSAVTTASANKAAAINSLPDNERVFYLSKTPPAGFVWSNGVLVETASTRAERMLQLRGSPKAPQKCKYGDEPATKSVLWFEGAAYVPVCDQHLDKAVDDIGGPDEVDKVVDIDGERSEADFWHNSDGPSHGDPTAEQIADHMDEHHHLSVRVGKLVKSLGISAAAMDKMHERDHLQKGECGAHEERDAMGEMSSAGLLLPKGPPKKPKAQELTVEGPPSHRFKGKDLTSCEVCHLPLTANCHRSRISTRAEPDPAAAHIDKGSHVKKARQQYDADIGAVEPGLEGAVKDYFAKQRQATLSRLQGKRGKTMLKRAAEAPEPAEGGTVPAEVPAGSINPDAIFESGFWADQLAKVLTPHFNAIQSIATSRVRHQVGAPDNMNDGTSTAAVAQKLADRAQASALSITGTTRSDIFAALQDGVAHGEGMAKLTDRINAIFDNADRVRAKMIAQTETIGAMNEAAQTYAQHLPDGVVGSKVWLAHHDQRTRPTHRIADGQQVPLNTPFVVGGYPMMQPGDPTAPPGEVINCRCGVGMLPPQTNLTTISKSLEGLVPETTLKALQKIQAERDKKYPVPA